MTSPSDTRVVALSIPARPEYIALCRLALSGLTQVRPLEPETLADLKLALTEACTNSVRHAYEDGREGVVNVRYELNGGHIAVEVADAGAGFIRDPVDTEPGELDEGGLGIAIIESLMDELVIESDPDGSRLRFVKYLS
jgi:serine/threonine-protein kinase RsbW